MGKNNQGKRKLKVKSLTKSHHSDNKPKSNKKRAENEEISSDSDLEADSHNNKRIDEYSEEEEETVQEKRLKLAKKYLSEIEEEEKARNESKELDRDIVSKRLRHDVLEKAGQLQKKIADSYESPCLADIRVFCGHKLPVTCLVISSDESFIISASKDSALIKWNLNDGKKLTVIPGIKAKSDSKVVGHSAQVQCLALSSDIKFLASGDANRNIHIWNANTMIHLKTFTSHRDAITGLVFRKNTHQLFSASKDRSVKVWNLDEMAYVETLFGHQDAITSIDSMFRDRAVTSGGQDHTIRLWKITEESQLIFQGHSVSVDCVRLINEQHFVTGADDGSISLWGAHKKKPLFMEKGVHGCGQNGESFWVTALAALPNTDLVASGSQDGNINFWKCGEDFKSLTKLFSVLVCGFVNALEFTPSGRQLIAGVGQEHKMGRWWRIKDAKNSIVVIPLKAS